MDLFTLQKNPKNNDLQHGRKHSFLDQHAHSKQRHVLHDLYVDAYDRNHHGFYQTLKNRIWRIRQGKQKIFPQKYTQSHTEPALCLGPTENLQCSYWFLNLRTGSRIKRHTFTPLPVPTRVIDRLHALTDTNKQKTALDFFECIGNPILYGDTPDDENEEDAKDLAGVEECENQPEMPGVTTPYHQEETPGVTTPEEEEEIMEI